MMGDPSGCGSGGNQVRYGFCDWRFGWARAWARSLPSGHAVGMGELFGGEVGGLVVVGVGCPFRAVVNTWVAGIGQCRYHQRAHLSIESSGVDRDAVAAAPGLPLLTPVPAAYLAIGIRAPVLGAPGQPPPAQPAMHQPRAQVVRARGPPHPSFGSSPAACSNVTGSQSFSMSARVDLGDHPIKARVGSSGLLCFCDRGCDHRVGTGGMTIFGGIPVRDIDQLEAGIR